MSEEDSLVEKIVGAVLGPSNTEPVPFVKDGSIDSQAVASRDTSPDGVQYPENTHDHFLHEDEDAPEITKNSTDDSLEGESLDSNVSHSDIVTQPQPTMSIDDCPHDNESKTVECDDHTSNSHNFVDRDTLDDKVDAVHQKVDDVEERLGRRITNVERDVCVRKESPDTDSGPSEDDGNSEDFADWLKNLQF